MIIKAKMDRDFQGNWVSDNWVIQSINGTTPIITNNIVVNTPLHTYYDWIIHKWCEGNKDREWGDKAPLLPPHNKSPPSHSFVLFSSYSWCSATLRDRTMHLVYFRSMYRKHDVIAELINNCHCHLAERDDVNFSCLPPPLLRSFLSMGPLDGFSCSIKYIGVDHFSQGLFSFVTSINVYLQS